jgi:hypothetical protein
MDGPISTSEAPGVSAPFTPAQMLNPGLGPPEKVTPVSKDSRPRSAGRHEVGESPRGTKGRSSDRSYKAEERGEAGKGKPAYFVEIEGAGTDDGEAAGRRPEPDENKEPLPLPGDPSRPKRYEDLADAIAAAKERWAEVNREALEANVLPRGGDPSEDAAAQQGGVAPSPPFSPPSGKNSGTEPVGESTPPKRTPGDVTTSRDAENLFVTRYQTLAMALSNPHRTRPLIDLFV